MKTRLIGDKAFYQRAFSLMIPVMVQNVVTSFVSLLDSLMVGQVGTEAMGAVTIANQLIMIFNMLIFGANAGAGIFSPQFVGAKDHEGVRYTFRFRIYICTVISAVFAAAFLLLGEELSRLYLKGEGDPAQAAKTLELSITYLGVMAIGLIPFAASSAYAGTLRETGQTRVPMIASVSAVLTNLVFNYILIFGHFGAPAMGVFGAAVATVISRFVELGIVAGWTHWNRRKLVFIQGVYRSLYIPGDLLKRILIKALPLLMNEVLFSTATAFINQSYTTCGLDVLPAMNIVSTLTNLVAIGYRGVATAASIMLGQEIGAGKSKQEVMNTNWQLLTMVAALATGCGVVMAALSGVFPLAYNTTQEVRTLASQLTLIMALFMPFNAYSMVIYFSIRSGGKVFTTMFYDSVSLWIFGGLLVFLLTEFTNVGIVPLYFAGHLVHFCKAVLGTLLVRKGDWVRNLVKK